MAKKKVKTDVVNKDLTVVYTDVVTAFKDGNGDTIFKLPITMRGAWSDHRIARAIKAAYDLGREEGIKPTWDIKPDGSVIKTVRGKTSPLDIKDAKGILKKKSKK